MLRKKGLKAIALSVGIIVSTLSLHSESLNQFRRYDVRSGMSSNTVKDIVQDRKGYMWFATKDGLNRFNGRDFDIFCSSAEEGNGLNIDALCQHISANKLWLAGPEGLYLFDCDNEICQKTEPDGWKFTNVNCLTYDRSGNLWIGCNDGVHRYNEKTGYLRHYTTCAPDRFYTAEGRTEENLQIVKAIGTDNYGNILVGHAGGICKYIVDNDCFGRSYRIDPDERNNDYNAVTAMLQIDVDKFLVGTQLGAVAEFSESTNSYRALPPPQRKWLKKRHCSCTSTRFSSYCRQPLLCRNGQRNVHSRHARRQLEPLSQRSV